MLTHEVVVPGDLAGHHEEAQEAIRQQHLHPLVVRGQVPLGVVPLVCVLPAPLIPAGGQLVGSEGAGAGGETEKGGGGGGNRLIQHRMKGGG